MPRRVRCDVSAFDGREKEEEQNECVLPSRRSMSTSIFSLFLFSSLILSHFSFLLPPPPSSNRTFAYLSVSLSFFLSFFLRSFPLTCSHRINDAHPFFYGKLDEDARARALSFALSSFNFLCNDSKRKNGNELTQFGVCSSSSHFNSSRRNVDTNMRTHIFIDLFFSSSR